MRVAWIVGEPCVGKTSLVRRLMEGDGSRKVTSLQPGVLANGSTTGWYATMDAVSGTNAAMVVRSLLSLTTPEVLLLDGPAMVAQEVLVQFVCRRDADLTTVVLEGADEAADRRRLAGKRFLHSYLEHLARLQDLWCLNFPGKVARVLADASPTTLAEQVRRDHLGG